MIAALRVLWRLLFYRPFVLVLLVLVYSTAALLLMTVESSRSGIAVAVMAAFAAAGLAALLTERITRYSLQAGTIGLPVHAGMMRRAQAGFLALFVAVPAALACVLGARPLAAIAALSVATAAGIVVAAYGAVWIILIPLLGKVLPLSTWASETIVQAAATAASWYVIWRWFDLPARVERAGPAMRARLADARHERGVRTVRRPQSALYDARLAVTSNDAVDAPAAVDPEGGPRVSAMLALGLGYSVKISWRRVLYGTGTGIAVLAAWQVLHGTRPAALAYLCVTAVCCYTVVLQLQRVLQRWMRTGAEQALLCLAPGWPESRPIKRAVIGSTLMVQRGTLAVWVCTSGVAASFGWVSAKELVVATLAVFGTALAFSAAVWAVLAQRRVREWHVSTIALVFVVAMGAVTIVLDAPALSYRVLAGAGMMVIPPALALVWYALAPLRLPLSVDPRALKSVL